MEPKIMELKTAELKTKESTNESRTVESKKRRVKTPTGDLYIEASNHGLRSIRWLDSKSSTAVPSAQSSISMLSVHSSTFQSQDVSSRGQEVSSRQDDLSAMDQILDHAEIQLREYFQGDRQKFELPLDIQGSDFQKRVWTLLQDIPYGTTRSYGDLATKLGDAKACRAVGMANGKNPLPIVIPCHRVIQADGSLGGFSGGLEVKKILLSLEGV